MNVLTKCYVFLLMLGKCPCLLNSAFVRVIVVERVYFWKCIHGACAALLLKFRNVPSVFSSNSLLMYSVWCERNFSPTTYLRKSSVCCFLSPLCLNTLDSCWLNIYRRTVYKKSFIYYGSYSSTVFGAQPCHRGYTDDPPFAGTTAGTQPKCGNGGVSDAVTSELGDRQSSHPVKTLLQYMASQVLPTPVSGTTAAP